MQKGLYILSVIVTFSLLANSAVASSVTYIPPGGSYHYAFSNPGTGWEQPGFDDSGWDTGRAPFGNQSSGDFAYNTYWPADGRDGFDVWLRIAVNLPAMSDLKYELGVDNGFALWINGTFIDDANAEGYTYRWEYSGYIDTFLLYLGTNTIAVALEDHGFATAFDMQLTGNPVAIPGAVWLFGSGLIALVGYRKKFKK